MGYRDDASRLLLCIRSLVLRFRDMFIETQAQGVTRKYSMRIRSLIPTGDTLQIVCTSAPTSRSPRRASALATVRRRGPGPRAAGSRMPQSLSLSATLARCDLLRSQSSNAWQHRGGSASKAKARLAFERDVLLGGTCLHSGRRQSGPDDATHAVLEPGVLARARVARVQKPRRALRMR